MKILTIIPARSGSKRVPGKNIKLLQGIPLLVLTVKVARRASLEQIMVSTDDKDIANVAIESGAEVPFARSSELATDKSGVIGAVLEAIDYYDKSKNYFEAVMLLQPTSPFRTVESIKAAVTMFDGTESVVSVSPSRSHPYWCKKVVKGRLVTFGNDDKFATVRSQDLPEAYELNGSIYLASVKTLKETHSFYSKNTKALIIDSEEEALDIDTPFDWMVAEAIARTKGLPV